MALQVARDRREVCARQTANDGHDLPAPPVAKGEKPAHDPAVELFKLPAFTTKDLAEMKTEAAMAPPPSNAPMRFTLKEIKGVLNVSESRVSQIHAQAVIHLRAKLRNLTADLGYREGDPNVKQKYTRKPQPA